MHQFVSAADTDHAGNAAKSGPHHLELVLTYHALKFTRYACGNDTWEQWTACVGLTVFTCRVGPYVRPIAETLILAESLPVLAGTSVHSNLLVKALLRGAGSKSAVYAESVWWLVIRDGGLANAAMAIGATPPT